MPSRSSIIRALAITAVLALAAIAHSALATTWVAWVPVQTSAGTTATFGNYWGGAGFMYSTQAVTWITPPMNTLGTATYDQIQNYLGTSGANLAVGLSSYSASSNYIYSGSVGATATVAYGSTSTTVSTSYSGYILLSVIYVSSETCIYDLYYNLNIYISATGTAYAVIMFGNATWSYVVFSSWGFSSTGWFIPGGTFGSSTCISPGYYLYVISIKLPGATTYVPNANLEYQTTSGGSLYLLGTMYSLNIAPAGGDTVVLPWTTSASPYVKLMFTQSVVNTAGSSAAGSFSVTVSGNTYSVSNAYTLLYFSDSVTNTFPSGQVTPTNCPTNVYALSTTTSSAVTKILSCQSLTSPSTGGAVYPGDYAKYSSTATTFITFPIPSGATTSTSFAISYTDSASNTYSASTTYGFQPTNPSISSNNAQGYLAQLPQCSITSNPYGGATGTTGLFGCVAIDYGAISAVVWFYEPSGGQGVLFSIEDQQYPNEHYQVPLLYVGTNGYLYANDWSGGRITVSTSSAISPGWHMAVFEEWYSSGTYYLVLYLDGSLVGQVSSSSGTILFNIDGGMIPMSYSDIGSGYAPGSIWLNTNNAWFFFNGTIAYVAVYNTVLSQSQVQAIYQAGFPNTLYSNNLVVSYIFVPDYYSGGGYYFVPYFVNSQIMSQMGISNAYATSITPSGSVGAIPSSQFILATQVAVYVSSYSILPITQYFVYARNPSITAGSTYYVPTPVPNTGWAYVGPEYLTSPNIGGATNVTVSLYALPSITAYPSVTMNTTTFRLPFSSSTTSYTIAFYNVGGDTETIGVTPNSFANTYLFINTTSYTVPSTATTATLYVPVASGTTYFYGQLPLMWGTTQYTSINAALLAKPGASNYPTLSLNTTTRFPFSSSATSYTLYFAVKPGDTENLGVTPNGLGVYFLSSNTTSYAIPSAPRKSILTIPTTTGVYIGQSLGDWWNVTNKPYYNLTLVSGSGSTGSFTIKVNGISNTASQFAWNLNNPPIAIVYFTGTDGYTYVFNPSWVQGFGLTQALVGSSIYFVPTVIGKTLTSTKLAFIAQGTWLNETSVNNSFMTYYPLPSFINFLSTPIYMYVNGTTSPRYLVPALAIINNNLQQYTVQYMNITAWSNVGNLMGVAIISTPFSFIGFVSNGSLTPIWILLNSTAGVPPVLFSYYPQIRYLLMPDTASVPYTLIQVYVNVPSQLFNQWSGNLVFGISQAMNNGYYALVSGGFYAPPPTQFSLYVPTYLLNKLAQLFLASYPQSTTCTMLQVLSNPLETTICQGISQVVTINLGQTQVGKPAFGDVPGAFNITPLTRNLTLEQVIAINAATAALVILFIKKHQSLPAGLMLGGAIALALGIFLWLEMEIGIGILLFVAGAALATTHRSQ